MLQFILVMTFLTTVLLVYGLYSVLFRNRIATLRRLEINTRDPDVYSEASFDTKLTAREQMGGVVSLVAKAVPQKKYFEEKKKKLTQAAVLMKPEEFLAISILASILTGALLYFALGNMIAIPIGILVGFKIPDLFLESAKSKRGKKLNAQLPEALTIISNGLRAGYSFTQAMGVAARELDNPISEEFSKVLRDNSLGKPIEEALTDMAKRAEDEDIDMFVTALIIQRQVGGNLAEVLDTISETIRERVKLKGEIKTLTSEGKLSAVVITVLPIAIAIVIALINPEYIRTLVTTTIGLVMVAAAVIMEIVGIYLLRKIVDIDI